MGEIPLATYLEHTINKGQAIAKQKPPQFIQGETKEQNTSMVGVVHDVDCSTGKHVYAIYEHAR